ncbi:unnamed protein product, partial [Linum tenue]
CIASQRTTTSGSRCWVTTRGSGFSSGRTYFSRLGSSARSSGRAAAGSTGSISTSKIGIIQYVRTVSGLSNRLVRVGLMTKPKLMTSAMNGTNRKSD